MSKGNSDKQKVVVIGAGPVGALAALYAANRGDDVEVYELRSDLRDPSTTPLNFTKSINLALSERGINALRYAGSDELLNDILRDTIPMHGRMIHGRGTDSKLFEEAQAYDVHGRYIRAVDRAGLNKRLLDSLGKMPNVKLFFNHKLTGADFNSNTAWIEQTNHSQNPTQPNLEKVKFRAPEISIAFDLLIGADGAHSATRYHMMKYARLNYQQEYIDTLWCEFQIPPLRKPESSFAISPDYLHIWPAGSSMFIAIPSLDKSFTCTLFAPSSYFQYLSSSPAEKLQLFFAKHFPGVCPELITSEHLQQQFRENPHLPLISIKCAPYHYSSSVVILGDAAHAMVPFYGQGMNAGLEDVRVLFEILDRHSTNSFPTPKPSEPIGNMPSSLAAALAEYTLIRTPDASTISGLALRNYEEMRAGVYSPIYRVRKWIEESLSRLLPAAGVRTQYARVSFENQRYSEVEREVWRQGAMLCIGGVVLAMGVFGVSAWGLGRMAARVGRVMK